VWQKVKEMLLDWARVYSSIYVISGSILDSNYNGIRDDDEIYNRCVRIFHCYKMFNFYAGGILTIVVLLSQLNFTL